MNNINSSYRTVQTLATGKMRTAELRNVHVEADRTLT